MLEIDDVKKKVLQEEFQNLLYEMNTLYNSCSWIQYALGNTITYPTYTNKDWLIN